MLSLPSHPLSTCPLSLPPFPPSSAPTFTLQRQRIVPEGEWEKFLESLRKPLPTAFRINTRWVNACLHGWLAGWLAGEGGMAALLPCRSLAEASQAGSPSLHGLRAVSPCCRAVRPILHALHSIVGVEPSLWRIDS